MHSSSLAVVPAPDSPTEQAQSAQVERAARALIGWMKPDDAHRLLRSNRSDLGSGSVIQAAQDARASVAARPDGLDQDKLVSDLPAELSAHLAELRACPAGAAMFAEGWGVALVDLTRVCAFQPSVLSDQAISRVEALDEHDFASIATVTLPLAQNVQLPVQFDQIRQAWIVVSANPNLRVVGAVGPMPAGPGGGMALGFAITLAPSFMQVARYRGRHFLRDGYHRAFGLLSRGISVVPAFVRDITAFEELVPDPRAMLPQDSYRGSQPPVLPDYLDDTVSASVLVPAAHKMIVVQGLELTPVG